MAKKKILVLKRIRGKAYTAFVNSKKITAARERANLTKTEAAKLAGWTPQKWNDFEKVRHQNPRIQTLVTGCGAIGCRVSDILTESR